MSGEMPPIGRRPDATVVTRIAGVALVIVAAGAGWLGFKRHQATIAPPPVAVLPPPPSPPPAPPAPENVLEKAGLHRVRVVVNGPLETAIVAQLGRGPGARLTQVVSRALVWWIDMPGDLRKGDHVDVLYEERSGEEPVVHAIRFQSNKMNKTFAAYRYKPEGARFARMYQVDGNEIELRLVDAPLDDYEQVTSLLRDGRGHKGVDFKTPVGSPVKATFDGVVVRKNWNTRLNGNSLEVKEAGGGRTAMFLHLSEIPAATHAGEKVTRGMVLAQSGNTGHSFAPHLHYQLQSGNTVLDPFQVQTTTRRALSAADKPAFESEVHRLDGLLDATIAGS